jgi:putative sterol carrier protein
MATVAECRLALESLAARISSADSGNRRQTLDRSLGCHLTDLDVHFRGRLNDGKLTDIAEDHDPKAQIRLAATSDDLIALTDGSLDFAKAWASGRLKVHASVFDLMKLRKML